MPKAFIDFHAGLASEPDWSAVDAEAWQHAIEEARALELGTAAAATAIDVAIEKLKARHDDTFLIGGPPCQAYSLVGRARSRGKVGYVPEEDARHYLFREYIRVLDKLRPAAFVMENVKGMLSSTVESRLVFEMLIEDLSSLGTGHAHHYELRAIRVEDGKAGFWGDDGTRYRAAYFSRFPGIWCQGDFAEQRDTGGFVIHGRSDATLNPGRVRIGTAEIYSEVEKFSEVRDSVAIGQEMKDDVRVVLFLTLAEGASFDQDLAARIKAAIRAGTSPRHVPALIVQVAGIPRTKSGKVAELAVREAVHGRPIKNTDSLANPKALDCFRNLPELSNRD